MSLPAIYSLIFYLACVGYSFFGIFTMIKDKNLERKLTFLGVCLSLSLWSFSFAVANSADNLQMAVVWRRVAVLGWGSMYAFLLHFMLALAYLIGANTCFISSYFMIQIASGGSLLAEPAVGGTGSVPDSD